MIFYLNQNENRLKEERKWTKSFGNKQLMSWIRQNSEDQKLLQFKVQATKSKIPDGIKQSIKRRKCLNREKFIHIHSRARINELEEEQLNTVAEQVVVQRVGDDPRGFLRERVERERDKEDQQTHNPESEESEHVLRDRRAPNWRMSREWERIVRRVRNCLLFCFRRIGE